MRSAVRIALFGIGAAAVATTIAVGCSSFSADQTSNDDAGADSGAGTLSVAWAKGFGPGAGGATLVVGDLAVRETGEAFVIGTYSGGTVDLPDASLPAASGQDAFLFGLAGDGAPIFSRAPGLPKDQLGAAVATYQDQIFEGLIFDGVLADPDIGGSFTAGGAFNSAISRVESKGITGAYGLIGAGNDQLRALSSIAGGELIAFGEWDGMDLTITLPDGGAASGPQIHRSAGAGPALFVSRLYRSGAVAANQRSYCPAGSLCYAHDMVASALGDVTISGRFSGKIDFQSDGGTFTSVDGDAYIARLDGTLFPQWATVFGGGGVQENFAVALIPGSDDVVVGGTFDPELVVPGTNDKRTSKGGTDIYVARLDGAGTPKWTKTFGGAGADSVGGLAADAQGNIFLAGSFKSPTIDFGGPPLTNAGSAAGRGTGDVYVAWLAGEDGHHMYSARFGGPEEDGATRVRVDGVGNIVLAGTFTTSIDFGGHALTGGTMPNGFVTKLTR